MFYIQAQEKIPTIHSEELKKIYDVSKAKQIDFINATFPNLVQGNLELLDVSFETEEDSEGMYTRFDPLAKSHTALNTLENIRYHFLYRYGKIGFTFDIIDQINGEVRLSPRRNLQKLDVLNRLALNQCTPCLQSLQQYINKNKIIHYKADIQIMNQEASGLAEAFFWTVVKTPQTKKGSAHFLQGGSAVFIDPKNGAIVDMSKYYMPPRIVRD